MLRAVDTIDCYYTAQVNHDMGSGNFTDEPDVSDKGQENEELFAVDAINLFSGDMLLINGFRNRANKKC